MSNLIGWASIAALVVGFLYLLRHWLADMFALVRGTWRVILVGVIFIAIGLFCAYWVVQFIEWMFAFWPPLVTVLSWLAWGLGVLIPGVIAAEVCDGR